jgi:hypothetical protein
VIRQARMVGAIEIKGIRKSFLTVTVFGWPVKPDDRNVIEFFYSY